VGYINIAHLGARYDELWERHRSFFNVEPFVRPWARNGATWHVPSFRCLSHPLINTLRIRTKAHIPGLALASSCFGLHQSIYSAKSEDGARCQMHYCVPIYCTAELRRLRMAHAGSAGCLLLVVVELAFVGLQTGPLGHRMLSCR
jgi:hypothetical protein